LLRESRRFNSNGKEVHDLRRLRHGAGMTTFEI